MRINENIEPIAEVDAIFEKITIGDNKKDETIADNEGFRGDNVSADLRDMMAADPTGKKRVDVILQSKDADNKLLRNILAANNVRLTDRIGNTDTVVVNLPLSAVEILAQSGLVNYMSPDRPTLKLGHLENSIGTNLVRSQPATPGRAAYSLDGSGIGIAVVDSGMAVNHNSFKTGTTNRIVFSKNFVDTENTIDDNYGHGTHVAGIAAGNSTMNNGAYRGIAANANIINLRVLDSNGAGKASWLLNAMQWLLDNHQTYNIRVVNLSLGGAALDTYTNDPVCRKVQELSAKGVLIVAAAGNEGKNGNGEKVYGHIHSPGNDPSALTVGAINTMQTDSRNDDVMATFSSRGPTRSFYTDAQGRKIHDNALKPDMVAPGNKIISAKSKSTSYLVQHYPALSDSALNSTVDDSLMYMSGTSMATPVVAGAAALLFELNPKLTPQMIKMILEYTAQPLNGCNTFEQGAGALNLEGAVRLANAYKPNFDFNVSGVSGKSLLNAGATFPF